MIPYSENWDGIFEQKDELFKFSVKLIQTGEKIEGEIEDYFGTSTISGTFEENTLIFQKTYYNGLSIGARFNYNGIYNSSEKQIVGRWHQLNYPPNNGEFWLKIS